MNTTERALTACPSKAMSEPFVVRNREVLVAEAPGRTVRLTVFAPAIASKWKPGQFVVVRRAGTSERIPVTIAGSDCASGTIEIVIQEVGKSTADLVSLSTGDEITDVCGPLGRPSKIGRFGVCALLAGGYGVAAIRPIADALRSRGNWVVSILGARESRLLILEDELRRASDVLYVATDDGSAGIKGNVLVPLATAFDEWNPDRLLAVGSLPMMRAVSDYASERRVPAVVSLNPIMLDGTGMCGACRVRVKDETHFACVDGPEFDAAGIDFDDLAARQLAFREFEQIAWGGSIA